MARHGGHFHMAGTSRQSQAQVQAQVQAQAEAPGVPQPADLAGLSVAGEEDPGAGDDLARREVRLTVGEGTGRQAEAQE
jgi:hypothetical protein